MHKSIFIRALGAAMWNCSRKQQSLQLIFPNQTQSYAQSCLPSNYPVFIVHKIYQRLATTILSITRINA